MARVRGRPEGRKRLGRDSGERETEPQPEAREVFKFQTLQSLLQPLQTSYIRTCCKDPMVVLLDVLYLLHAVIGGMLVTPH